MAWFADYFARWFGRWFGDVVEEEVVAEAPQAGGFSVKVTTPSWDVPPPWAIFRKKGPEENEWDEADPAGVLAVLGLDDVFGLY